MSSRPSSERERFIEDVASVLVPWGLPQTAARIYGYLLLSRDPASLDRIAVDLQMSKSSASVATRLLETYTLVCRRGERGSKRALYEASDNYERMLTEQNRLLDAIAALLHKGAAVAGSGSVSARLEEMADFYRVTRQAMESVLRQWRARREKVEKSQRLVGDSKIHKSRKNGPNSA